MKKVLFGVLVVGVLSMVMSCGNKNSGTKVNTESFGHLKLALNGSGPTHDVVAIQVKIVDAEVDCASEAVAIKTENLKPEALSGSVLPAGAGPLHPFADALFVLPVKEYRVCATPLDENAYPSFYCGAVDKIVNLIVEATVEVVLISQCKGDPNGGLDVVTILNDPPLITNLQVDSNKFISTCKDDCATITVIANDPNGDSLGYEWSFSPSTGELISDGNVARFCSNTVGDYAIKVVVTDALGGQTSLTFPIHVRECCDPVCPSGEICCKGTCKAATACEGCGDGVIIPPETCDPPSTCPTNCEDDNACTVDSMMGSAETCTAACVHTPLMACISGDSCCPRDGETGTPLCNNNEDSDCPCVCGNQVIEPACGEICDGNCPTVCNDDVECTTDTLENPGTCQAKCTFTAITVCVNDDDCCPNGCTIDSDNDCSPWCGDTVVTPPDETCDPPSTCPVSCDDDNKCTKDISTGNADTCNVACSHEQITACVNDDGCCPKDENGNFICTIAIDSDCLSRCGDGVVTPPETCDGNCPTTCDDGDPCTIDDHTGSAENCDFLCTHTLKTKDDCNLDVSDNCCPKDPTGKFYVCTPCNDIDCHFAVTAKLSSRPCD